MFDTITNVINLLYEEDSCGKNSFTKSKRTYWIINGFVLAFVSFPWSTSVKAEEKKQEKAPSEKKIVFPVVSDVHIKNSGTDDTFRWKRAIEQLNTLAPKQDAFVIVGDFTDSGSLQQYDRFMQVYNANANKDAVRMNSLGNHDYWNGLSVEGAQKRFLEKQEWNRFIITKW